jgi:hypothetical protein
MALDDSVRRGEVQAFAVSLKNCAPVATLGVNEAEMCERMTRTLRVVPPVTVGFSRNVRAVS